MKRLMKRTGVVLALLVAVLLLVGAALYAVGGSKFDGPRGLAAESVRAAAAEEARGWGQHVAETHGCTDCHGARLEGAVMVDAPPFRVVASNLTKGAGGVGSGLDALGWERAIRHGVGADGRGLVIMPSEVYTNLSDDELAALIAHLQALPPVDNELPATKVKPLGRVIAGLGGLKPTSALIDHEAPHAPTAPSVGATVEYGRYRASTTCIGCHGEQMEGAPPLNPEAPPGPSLRHVADWTEEQFRTTLRTGVTPAGLSLNPEFMPWQALGRMRDDELEAIRRYIGSLPAATAPSGG
jgi:cytochrome c553